MTYYVGIGFSQPGCLLDSPASVYAFNTRGDLMRAIQEHCNSDSEFRKARNALGIRNLWPFIARHGASMIVRELPTNSSEVLCILGLTEQEYNDYCEAEGE